MNEIARLDQAAPPRPALPDDVSALLFVNRLGFLCGCRPDDDQVELLVDMLTRDFPPSAFTLDCLHAVARQFTLMPFYRPLVEAIATFHAERAAAARPAIREDLYGGLALQDALWVRSYRKMVAERSSADRLGFWAKWIENNHPAAHTRLVGQGMIKKPSVARPERLVGRSASDAALRDAEGALSAPRYPDQSARARSGRVRSVDTTVEALAQQDGSWRA